MKTKDLINWVKFKGWSVEQVIHYQIDQMMTEMEADAPQSRAAWLAIQDFMCCSMNYGNLPIQAFAPLLFVIKILQAIINNTYGAASTGGEAYDTLTLITVWIAEQRGLTVGEMDDKMGH